MNTIMTSDMTSAIMPAAIDVANDRKGNNPGRGGTDALDEAQRQQPAEGRHEDDDKRADTINAEAAEKRRLAAESSPRTASNTSATG